MRLRAIVLGLLLAAIAPGVAGAAGDGGRLGGMVIAQGTPQLGATVVVTPEARPGAPLRLVTDSRGRFASETLLPGLYSVRVRLAGFLPAFQPRIHVANGHLTLLRIELGSIFSSVEQLRHGPRTGHDPDEWAWVLRSATLTRPVLRFSNGRVVIGDSAEKRARAGHGRAELTSGTLSSWSPANPQAIGSTSFLYDQGLGGGNRLLLAGRVGYEHSPTAGFAATWTRSGDALGNATESTTVVFRQAQIGTGETAFRGLEIDHIRKMQVGDRLELEYGGQYIVATMNGMASVARPEARLQMKLQPGWTASLLLSSDPLFGRPTASPLDSLDSFPTPLEGAGRLALDRAWHEEITLEHNLSRNATIAAAVFHDSDAHTALFG
ncbi:MAG: carboxypeptidase-like regulatory domain-containing protein, partial [Gemmatimonadota bacterium]